MRELSSYGAAEWLRAAPFAHGLRRGRNILVDRIYARRVAQGQPALVARLAQEAREGRPLAFTIAFNLPEAIELLADAMARFAPEAALVVCDNSSNPDARAAIARFCAARGVACLGLPPSPYAGGRNGSRSHGVALNWVHGNLVRPAGAKVFAFLDHDLVPLAPVDLAALVSGQPCYGMVRQGPMEGAWYLWPGLSVFDGQALTGTPLDFGTDTPLGLDTGGQNWHRLYRALDPSGLRHAETCTVHLEDPATGVPTAHLLADQWLHVGGVGHAGTASALARAKAAFAADPEGLLPRLLASRSP